MTSVAPQMSSLSNVDEPSVERAAISAYDGFQIVRAAKQLGQDQLVTAGDRVLALEGELAGHGPPPKPLPSSFAQRAPGHFVGGVERRALLGIDGTIGARSGTPTAASQISAAERLPREDDFGHLRSAVSAQGAGDLVEREPAREDIVEDEDLLAVDELRLGNLKGGPDLVPGDL